MSIETIITKCVVNLDGHQLTSVIGPSNILLLDVVKEKVEPLQLFIKKKVATINKKNFRIRRLKRHIEKEKESSAALAETVKNLIKLCETLKDENFKLQSEVCNSQNLSFCGFCLTTELRRSGHSSLS
jgi:hypothetical protein